MKVGIVGTGFMGSTHARGWSSIPGIELVVNSRQAERDSAFAAKFGATTADSLDDLFKKVDIVDVCTPTDIHIEIGLKAVAAGRAVFMEKPITRNLEDGLALMNAVEKAGVPLMVGQVDRYFHEFETARNMVKKGAVGTPAAARTRRGGTSPGRWFMDHKRSGGILLDLAIHDFDWLRWTLGEVKSLYSRTVAAQTDEGPDYGLTTLTFDSGAIAHVEATWMDPSGFRTTFEVAGSGGLIQFDSRNTATLRTHTTAGTTCDHNFNADDDPYRRELNAFYESIKAGQPSPVPAYEGVMAASIALAAIESAKTGKAVSPVRV